LKKELPVIIGEDLEVKLGESYKITFDKGYRSGKFASGQGVYELDYKGRF